MRTVETTVRIYGYLRDHANKKVTAQEIANKFDISIRTVYRYIGYILLADFNILSETGRNGGYKYVE